MEVDMRYMRTKDLRSFLQAHHDAVRGIAAKDYPPAVIEQWAPLPITEKHVERVRANPET
jgi:putative acetyltransferase